MLAQAKEQNQKSKEKKGEDQKQATVTKGSKKVEDMAFVIHEIALAGKKSLLDEYDILCDNQATINIFRNKDMLRNIRTTDDPISVGGVGGVLEVNLVGDLPGFGEVYYNPECIANILCYHDLAKNKMIKFDNEENLFFVNLFGRTCHFTPKDKCCTSSTADQQRESFRRRLLSLYRRWRIIKSYTPNGSAAMQRWQDKLK